MAITYKTQGVILRSRESRAADRLYIIYTSGYGKIAASAKSVKKATSKLAGHLEPLTLSNLHLAQSARLDKIAGSQIIKSYKSIKQDMVKLNNAFYFLEIVDKITPEGLSDKRIFNLLVETLEYLENNPHHPLINHSFALKILEIQGFCPTLDKETDLNKILKFLLTQEYSQIIRLKIDDKPWQELEKFMHSYLEYQLEDALQTRKFLV